LGGNEALEDPANRSRTMTINVVASPSGVGRPVAAEDLDRPSDLEELPRIASDVRMVPLRALAVRAFDGGLGRPSATDSRRLDSDACKAQDPERGLNPFRLQIELPQIREDATGFVAALDAVALVVARNRRSDPVVPSAGKAEVPLDHGSRRRGLFMAFRSAQAKGYARRRRSSLVSFRSGPAVFKDQG